MASDMKGWACFWATCVEVRSANHRLVLLCLAVASDPNFTCFPSGRGLAHMTKLSLRTIRRVLPDLEADGLITRTKRDGLTDLIRLKVRFPISSPGLSARTTSPVVLEN